MKKWLLTACVLLFHTAGNAQQAEQFTIATMNIDGLPKKILVFNVNKDGPGAEGTSRIGKYLMQKDYDIVCMQEDFNYHDVLVPWLEDVYQVDSCSGRIDYDVKDANIDLRYPQNIKFPGDGLSIARKKGITQTAYERLPWTKSFGKFSHAVDDMITKGFRRHELTLPQGTQIIVYNMHMDASSDIDEVEGKDSLDRVARLSQWKQLTDDVLAHLDSRPIVVVGDLNSYYCRDDVKKTFIDAIEASGKGVASDVWVELKQQGVYPKFTGEKAIPDGGAFSLKGETLDKILYVNPVDGTQLSVTACKLDSADYKHNGVALGDHYPLVATFSVKNRKSTSVKTLAAEAQDAASEYYQANGQRISAPAKGLYIERRGKNSVKKIK